MDKLFGAKSFEYSGRIFTLELPRNYGQRIAVPSES